MNYALTISTLLALAGAAAVVAQNNCYQEKGNWYCSAVQAISYSNFGTPGKYQKVATMGSSGECDFAAQSYSGGMAPMDEEVSWHFRGPIQLKQFAFYTAGSGNSKRSTNSNPHQRRYAHKHLHNPGPPNIDDGKEEHQEHRRGVGDWVTATINGEVVSWQNQYTGGAAATPAPAANNDGGQRVAPGSASAAYSAPPPAASMNAGSGNWGRQSYYNAEQGTADGLVFLNYHGGEGSGVFDTTWGMSLSFASADNSAGSASPVTLADTLIADNSEFVIMSDKPCSGGSCGIVRDGTVAYHGFDGASKLFLLEFGMPLSGNTGFNGDMPAAWVLNAQIPRTIQYGNCSCWTSGCGEFDVFEVLDSGNQKCKSTWHGINAKGDSNWFQRPTRGTMKAAVVFDGSASTAHIVVLSDNFSFDESVPQASIAASLNSISDPTKNIRVALDS
ncbi:target of Sbf [Cladophialophora chaetospira]|uniref:glucan endo-1,3-beta-D-glucosidase n=1 Tax=Cladophialophora chaetospira TaxID=386627 RepID=A0AA39CIU7_9EURO|nr:target of Sbf [Cladophialophora chaetospira]